MADIFISYAHEDRVTVQALAEALEELWTVWWDQELRTGDAFRSEITKELAAAHRVIVLWSRHSIDRQKPWVASEADSALKRDVLHPIKIDEVRPPMPYEQLQTLDMIGWSGDRHAACFQHLVAALREKIPSRKRALLIGVGSYQEQGTFSPIASASKNIQRLRDVLEGDQGCGFTVTSLIDPERKELQKAAEDLFKLAEAGHLVMLYFCGHAKLSTQHDLYLCANDAESSHLDSTTFTLYWLATRAINMTHAAQVLLLFDCVYSSAESATVGVNIASVLQQSLGSGKPKCLLTASTVMGADIAKQGEEVSWLVKWFERGVRRFEADVNQDNIITADELCRFLKDQIAQDVPAMRPEEWGFNINSGEGEIARRAKTSTPAASRLPSDGPFFTAVRAYFGQKRVILFLGEGIYSGGPLSAFELVGALVQSATQQAGFKVDERYPLATAAEYLHQVLSADRSIFLAEFRRILDEKSTSTRGTATHDFILSMATPWLVVSATYDWTLEAALIATGKPFTVVAHILHATDGKDEGKLLIMRSSDGAVSTETRLADDWGLSDLGNASERVIYKLVGSPYLHDYLAPEQGVDTVVITETDHMEFLGRLQNEHARVPSAFAPPFKRSALLFLGYNLDVWHYRLVGHIFSDGGLIKTGPRFAVRTATSPIEERFWSQLVADRNRLESDCEAFVLTFGGR